LALQQPVDRREQARRQIVLLQEVAKVEDRGLVGKSRRDIGKTRETTQALDVVEPVLHLAVRQGEPLLEKVDPQHRGQTDRRTAAPAGPRIVRFHHRQQLRPRHHRVHLGQKQLATGPPLLVGVLQIGKTPLTQHSSAPALPDPENLTNPAAMANKSAVP
jgi:hypothetical protein